MKGFIIFQNTTGQLLYSKNYNSYPYTTSQDPVVSEAPKQRGFSSGVS
jgi:adenylosuccinate synthase